MANEFSSRIAKENDDANSVLSVSVVARERTLAWKQLVWYCMNLENLLKTYPGLLVTRCTVSQRDQRFNVDQLLSDQEHFTQLSIGTDQKYLPADMGWYTNKSRQLNPVTDPAKSQTAAGASNESALSAQVAHLQQGIDDLATIMGQQSDSMERRFQQNAEHIDAIAKEIQRSQIALITGMKNKAQFPSLWTLEYQQPEKASGDGGMRSGIISSLKRKVMTTVVLKFRSELSGQCHHEPITISVAPELLSRYGKFLKTSAGKMFLALSPMVSGVVVNPTEYIWASRDEILQHGHDIMFAVDYSRRGEANPLNSIEDTVVAQVNVPVEPFPPVPTETLPLVVPTPPHHGLPIDYGNTVGSTQLAQVFTVKYGNTVGSTQLAIVFTVKYGNTVGSTQLAQGSTSFVSLKPGRSTTQEVCLVKNNKPAGSLQVYLEAFA
ncbi:hypothetical protein PR002_g17106 [Phytophthora rubi]|uniref:Uncharacterized protein n=1 Tax=Phytophthora rubi TaxID=129364 RepID=A0A6A3KKN0_9STRA|nr:hypothetical protein PR002_g17106 [Phytophthora rubi]